MTPPRLRVAVFVMLIVSMATTSFAFIKSTETTTFYRGLRSSSSSSSKGVTSLCAKDNSNSGPLAKKAYNDDALFNFHMMTQRQKIRDYSAMDSYVNTQSLWNLAWHDSFVRNGLSDFVPPLTDTLNVLVVGNRYQGPGGDIAMVEDDGPSVTSALADSASIEGSTKEEIGEAALTELNSLQKSQDSSCSFLAAISGDDNSNIDRLDEDGNSINNNDDALDLPSYDCIMDQGLIADLLGASTTDSKNKEDIARLLFEATKRIREMGIYVANTPPMSLETKEYLKNMGQLLGLQWEFHLDGISDEKVSVSVARKFGTCPTIGWQRMARMIEE